MKKSIFLLLILFVFLTTYSPKFSLFSKLNFNIKKIIIENNLALEANEINEKLNFLYNENLLFLKKEKIANNLKMLSFIDSFSIKKIYPDKLKLIIIEKKPIAILHYKKEKNFISDKGLLINFKDIEIYNDLPTVFGNGKNFYTLYKDLQKIKFPLMTIKSFYFFKSGRWDLIMQNQKIIKLPIKNQVLSLEHFMELKKDKNFDRYKIFDFRIKDQLILN